LPGLVDTAYSSPVAAVWWGTFLVGFWMAAYSSVGPDCTLLDGATAARPPVFAPVLVGLKTYGMQELTAYSSRALN